MQALFKGLGLPPITDEEVEAATYAHGSKDMPERVRLKTSRLLKVFWNAEFKGLI